MRMSEACLDLERGFPASLNNFVREVVRRVGILAEYGNRYTVIPNDVALALKQMGM